MTTIHQKLEILHSLNNLNAVQSEKVLIFIKGIVQGSLEAPKQAPVKQQAMKEIRLALDQSYLSF